MRYDYDVLGTRLHQASMEAGERWILSDVARKTALGWDSRQHVVRTEYDALRRPIAVYLTEAGGPETLVERTVYGESQPAPEQRNLRAAIYQVFDGAGIVTNEAYDFKSNLLRSTRQLAVEYKTTLDWSASVSLEPEAYTSSTTFDALNRPTSMTTPDGSVVRPTYNEANLLERVDANLRGASAVTSFVSNIDYDAKGQRVLVEYGNGAKTAYTYDPLTFRLTRLRTDRSADRLQDLNYTYDPVGNVTYIRDGAQQTIYFRNQRVDPSADYTYDAIYRLVAATGREHLGQTGVPAPTSPTDAPRVGLPHPGDGQAMGRYLQKYVYDEVGNILQMAHRGTDPANGGWTRTYGYEEPSLLEPGQRSNRLSSTTVDGDTGRYGYDAHGNMTSMPHLPMMQWDHRDRLQATARQVVNDGSPETTFYAYDAEGRRVRKVTDLANGVRKDERIYLGPFEVYRRYEAGRSTAALERQTLHVLAGEKRIAIVENVTQGNDGGPPALARYQLSNHLGSALLELDDEGAIISYEEYFPYGSTSYQAVRSATEVPKRYRFTGKERDEESGFSYHNARYYAPWLTRWTSVDPAGLIDGPNVYRYARDNPVGRVDPEGTDSLQPDPKTLALVAQLLANATAAAGAGAASATPTAAGAGASAVPAAGGVTLGVAGVALAYAAAVLTAHFLTVRLHMQRSASIARYGNPYGMPSEDIAFPVLRAQRELQTELATLPAPLPEPQPDEQGENKPVKPGRIYVTYTKYNTKTGLYYSGRTSAVIDLTKPWRLQALAAVRLRDANHHVDEKDEPNDPSFEPAVLDQFAVGLAVDYNKRYSDVAYLAIRGREQQLIDYHGAQRAKELKLERFDGGARSDTPTPQLTENKDRGVSKNNPYGEIFHTAANLKFGELYRYTGDRIRR